MNHDAVFNWSSIAHRSKYSLYPGTYQVHFDQKLCNEVVQATTLVQHVMASEAQCIQVLITHHACLSDPVHVLHIKLAGSAVYAESHYCQKSKPIT